MPHPKFFDFGTSAGSAQWKNSWSGRTRKSEKLDFYFGKFCDKEKNIVMKIKKYEGGLLEDCYPGIIVDNETWVTVKHKIPNKQMLDDVMVMAGIARLNDSGVKISSYFMQWMNYDGHRLLYEG